MAEATQLISLTVGVDNSDAWIRVWDMLNDVAKVVSGGSVSVSVSSQDLSPDLTELEVHNDETLSKVAVGLREAGLTPSDVIVNAIRSMQNNGILFRERS